MLPVVSHPGFANPAGANAAPGLYASATGPIPRPARRDSSSRGGVPRPSSGSSRYEYASSRAAHQNTVASVELAAPVTVDVASSTDASTDSVVTGAAETAGVPVGNIDGNSSVVHQTEVPAAELLPRRSQPPNWRHADRETSSR